MIIPKISHSPTVFSKIKLARLVLLNGILYKRRTRIKIYLFMTEIKELPTLIFQPFYSKHYTILNIK